MSGGADTSQTPISFGWTESYVYQTGIQPYLYQINTASKE